MDENVKDAFYQSYCAESKAALRLKLFADKADEDGYPQMAKLFRAISRSEELHGIRSLRMLDDIKSTEENLAMAFESETNVAETAYDKFIKLAQEKDDDWSTTVFSQIRDVEQTHGKLYKEAMGHMMEERDTTYHMCKVCGFVSDGVIPDECPVCGASKENFETLD